MVLLFVGRVQPLKGPDVALKTAAKLIEATPGCAARCGWSSSAGRAGGSSGPTRTGCASSPRTSGSATTCGSSRPCPQAELAQWYRAATMVLTPSHSESFGLVALEAQACGTPVVAARVGGLRTVVSDGRSGVLVDGHDPADWARVGPAPDQGAGQLQALSAGARRHASAFGWSATVDRLAKVYTGAMDEAVAPARVGALAADGAEQLLRRRRLGGVLDGLGLSYEHGRSRARTWSASRESTSSPR